MLPVGIASLCFSASGAALDHHAISGSSKAQKVFERVATTNLTSKGSDAKMTAQEIAAALSAAMALPDGVSLGGGEGYRLDLAGSTSHVAHSYIDGYKVCATEVKSVTVGAATYLIGDVATAAPRESFGANDFMGPTAVASAIAERFDGRKVAMDASAPCLYPMADGDYRPAYYVWFAVDGRQRYRGYHDGDAFLELHPVHFDVDGTARIYATNPKAGTIQVFDLLGLTESGRLGNGYFITRMDPNTNEQSPYFGASRAFKADNAFHFDGNTSSSAFMETSIFTNANRILGFFASIGYSNFGGKKIILNLHPSVAANAQYLPAGSTTDPVISIGDGLPGTLENLTLDMDVVNHEFGHHVVFGSLRSTGTVIDGTRQVLVMHEALADYFAFAFSGDSCLGESICPSGSPVCAVANQCLRTASNAMTMTSGPSSTEEHVRGQFLSGFLWDIRREAAVTNKAGFDTLVLKAVELLGVSSGYQDLLLNLYTVDRDTNGGAYCGLIQNHAKNRDLAQYLNYDCSSGNYERLAIEGGGGGGSSSRSSSRSSGLFSFCGTIKGQSEGQVSLIYLLGGLIPMLWWRRREQGPSHDA